MKESKEKKRTLPTVPKGMASRHIGKRSATATTGSTGNIDKEPGKPDRPMLPNQKAGRPRKQERDPRKVQYY